MDIGIRLERVSDWLEEKTQRYLFWILAAISVLYFSTTCLLASQKLLWYDELFTLQMAQLPTVADLWSELAKGTDPLPPLFYLTTRACIAVFGDNQVGVRMPAIIGFWVMGLCLYRFVRQWCPPLYALVALLFPMATGAYHIYAFEAKPYGLLLGLTGLVLVCWQAAALGHGRPWTLLGLTLLLATALSCHYYAVVLFIPLGLAELARLWSSRKLDWAMAAAILAGLAPLFFFLPLIRASATYMDGYEGKPGWDGIFHFYRMLLELDLLPLVMALAFLVVYPRLLPLRKKADENASLVPPLHEMVLVVAFAFLPVFVILLAKTVTGGYYHRYAITAVLGCAIGVAFVACRYANGSRVLAMMVLLFLAAWVPAKQFYVLKQMREKNAHQLAIYDQLQHQEGKTPIAIAHAGDYFQLVHYAPPELAPRLYYVNSKELSLHYLGHSTMEYALKGIKPLAHLNVEDYSSFLAEHQKFLVQGTGGWLMKALLADGKQVKVKSPGVFLVEDRTSAPPERGD